MKPDSVVTVIGAGPSGLAAASQMKRQGFEPLMFEKGTIGGLLNHAYRVENYPGFPGGIPGSELVGRMWNHASDLGVTIHPVEITELWFEGNRFHLSTSSGESYSSRIAVIASGTINKRMASSITGDNTEDKVVYDITEIVDIRGRDIVIIGGGDAAFDYALNLSRHNRIRLMIQGNSVRCLDLLHERVSQKKNISIHMNSIVTRIHDLKSRLRIMCTTGKTEYTIEADYLIPAIGRDPNLEFLDTGIINARAKLVKENILHFIGDVHNGRYRQAAIAVGDGVRVAMKIAELIRS